MPLYLGLMSGTSLDGVDIVLVEISGTKIEHLAATTMPMPVKLREEILALINDPDNVGLTRLGVLDASLGEWFGNAALSLLTQTGYDSASICAIGSHGQTLWHQPNASYPFSMQLGDPARITELTGITTVADFRRRDLAAGGQGAPLVPAFHYACLGTRQETRIILNLGGMANITLLPASLNEEPTGFDTGPGNVLMDLNARQHLGQPFDPSGTWAGQGVIDEALLAEMLADPYFATPPPKSTGREHFNERWLQTHTRRHPEIRPENIQATLAELTARSVAEAIKTLGEIPINRTLVCGGGVHNQYLMDRLRALLAPHIVESTLLHGIDPDHMEATAFAWLADRTMHGLPGNLTRVTGARHPVILGAIYPGNGFKAQNC